MSPACSVILIGPMGAGKSTIGRQLAQHLHFQFVDTDKVIESRTGADIPWIFDVEGEDGFRKREAAVLTEFLGKPGVVLATGGGIVVRPENRQLLESVQGVVYLTASLDRLVERTAKDKKRPLLQVENPRERIGELLVERDPLYRQVADIVIDTDKLGAKAIVDEIARQLGQV